MDFCSEYKYLNDPENVFVDLKYEDLIQILDNFGSALVIIGGSLSENMQAVMKEVNDIAKREGVEKVLVYNPRFINVFQEEEDLRDCLTLENKLKYYYIVEKTKFKSDTLVRDTLIAKMDVPTFFAIKNGTCVDYFTSKYVKDPYIHLENDLEDRTLEFDLRLTSLIRKLKEKRRFE